MSRVAFAAAKLQITASQLITAITRNKKCKAPKRRHLRLQVKKSAVGLGGYEGTIDKTASAPQAGQTGTGGERGPGLEDSQ